MNVPTSFSNINEVITDIKLYKNNVFATKKFSFGTWTSRQHVFVSITAGGVTGYGENIITTNEPDVTLTEWQGWLGEIKGKTISEAIAFLRTKMGVWRDRMTEMTEMCLIDLAGKATKQNAIDMLGLKGTEPVCGVYVILSDDLAFVDERARWAVENNRAQFIKVKLFGRPSLDRAVIETVRRHAPRETTYLIGDVNGGYKMHDEAATPEQIASCLATLYEAGLDACEDPAYIDNEEWVKLQDLSAELALIPDYPMRPAWDAIKTMLPGMGRIYNIHPGSAGSVFDAIVLARHIHEIGAKLMIGDDSLIGPGCTIWQQLALGLKASWVEATEKPAESDKYYSTVKSIATNSAAAPIEIDRTVHGFGLSLDADKLAVIADEVYCV
ncbi:MAG: hypothetical protein RR576_01925 [Oscillospiraceae bacterium]